MASRQLIPTVALSAAIGGACIEVLSLEQAPIVITMLDWIVGVAFAAAAARLAIIDRPGSLLCLSVCATWYVATIASAPSTPGGLGPALILVHRAPLLHLLARTSASRAGQVLTVLAYPAAMAPARLAVPATTALAALIAMECLVAGLHAAANRRRTTRWAAAGSLAMASSWLAASVGSTNKWEAPLLVGAALIAVAGTIVHTAGPANTLDALNDLLVDLGPSGRGAAPVSVILGKALGHPDLAVRFRPLDGAWVDELGRSVPSPASDAILARAPDGGQVALVLPNHDRVDPSLAGAAAAAAALAISGAHLAARARQRAELTRRSRRRLLEVGDHERLELEQRLRTGAVSRLTRLQADLSKMDTPAATELAAEISTALIGLATLARGLYPATLLDRPLAEALHVLTNSLTSPTPVKLNGDPERLHRALQALAYYVCAESIANISHHAARAAVAIQLDVAEAGLHLEVVDDGPGGAQVIPGGGLQGLRDRAAAFGGELTVTSPLGGPTRISLTVPLNERPSHDGVAGMRHQ
jgi:signal transduction histidine kinase